MRKRLEDVVLVTHDDHRRRYCHRAMLIDSGKIVHRRPWRVGTATSSQFERGTEEESTHPDGAR
jgi:ABC-type polysaccharide/polyol phosphate transport system ATPase subunit